jgi:tRNA(adenine34) deaminase
VYQLTLRAACSTRGQVRPAAVPTDFQQMPRDATPPADLLVDRAMELALEEARAAAAEEEVPVGAAILGPDGALLARAHNEIERAHDPTAHAERLALTRAGRLLGRTRLPEGSLFAVTLEPCAMCAGALVLARADFLVFGASDPKAGACGSLRNIVADARLNHRVRTLPPRRAAECGALLTTFFRARRPASGPGCLPSDGCL